MKEDKDIWLFFILSMIIVLSGFGFIYLHVRAERTELMLQTYQTEHQTLIDRHKALQKELQDLKRYVQTGEGAGG